MWLVKLCNILIFYISCSLSANIITKFSDEKTDNVNLSYRLPNNTIPIDYDLSITTNIHKNDFKFVGNAKIRVKIVESTNTITFHSRDIEIDKIKVWNSDKSILVIDDAIFDFIASHDFLVIKLPQTYESNTEFILDIFYSRNFPTKPNGFYRGFYYDDVEKGVPFATTRFKPDQARLAFPCFDEPHFRAIIKLTIIHGSTYTALSSTKLIDKKVHGDLAISTFEPTPAIPINILGFIIFDYKSVLLPDSRITQKLYIAPILDGLNMDSFTLKIAGKVLAAFENVLDVQYPFESLHHIALINDISGSSRIINNLGLIAYREDDSLDFGSPDDENQDFIYHYIFQSICNQFASQWFSNVVTPAWWQYLWLSEGLSKFFDIYLPHVMNPNMNKLQEFYEITRIAFEMDVAEASSLNEYSERADDLLLTKRGIDDIKAASVIRMFMGVMTEKVFLEGVHNYIVENSMKSVTPENLHKALQKAYDKANPGDSLKIDQVMSTWENQAGYPLVTVTVSGNDLVFAQRRYPESNGEIYSVPITIASKTDPDFSNKTTKLWLNSASMTVPQSSLGYTAGDWMVLNIDQVGYYRVDYDKTLWKSIIAQLNTDHSVISPINRAVLQDEFKMAYFESSRVSISDVLDMLNYFDKEDYPSTWQMAEKTIQDLSLNLLETPAYDKFQELLRKITKPHLEKLNYDKQDRESMETTFFRSTLMSWNCLGFDRVCINKYYTTLLTFWTGHGDNNFDFCSGFKVMIESVFNEVLEGINNKELNHRRQYIEHIGCNMVPANLVKLLNAISNPQNGLDAFDRETILVKMVTTSKIGFDMGLDFVDKNYQALKTMLEDFYSISQGIAQGCKDQQTIAKCKNLIDKLVVANIIDTNEKESLLKTINSNQQWMEQYYPDVVSYFKLDQETTSSPLTSITTTESSPPPDTTDSTTTTTNPPPVPPSTTTTAAPGSANAFTLSVSLVFACFLIHLMKFA